MDIRKYTKECWYELWSPDSKGWQRIDRIGFFFLPSVAYILGKVLPEWLYLVQLIPLLIWLLFILLVVPYRLTNKYNRQRNEARALLKPKMKPLPNREELVGLLYDSERLALELIKCKRILALEKHFNNIDKQRTIQCEKVQSKYDETIQLIKRQIRIAGSDWEAIINQLLMPIQNSTASWSRVEASGKGRLDVTEKMLEGNAKEVIKRIDEINQELT